jgi:hypothetical protein
MLRCFAPLTGANSALVAAIEPVAGRDVFDVLPDVLPVAFDVLPLDTRERDERVDAPRVAVVDRREPVAARLSAARLAMKMIPGRCPRLTAALLDADYTRALDPAWDRIVQLKAVARRNQRPARTSDPARPEHPATRRLVTAALLAVLCVAAYANSFRAGFTLDSRQLILNDMRAHVWTADNLSLIAGRTYWWPHLCAVRGAVVVSEATACADSIRSCARGR